MERALTLGRSLHPPKVPGNLKGNMNKGKPPTRHLCVGPTSDLDLPRNEEKGALGAHLPTS